MKTFAIFFLFVGKQNGKAEEAVGFYVSLFPNSRVDKIERYAAGEGGMEGALKHGRFILNGHEYMAMDGGLAHNFTFSPAISQFITCESEEEIDELYSRLSEGGTVHMPLGEYPFSKKFTWVDDRYGVSWQLNLPN